jgi:hypothetical protein
MKPWREVAAPHKDVLEGTFLQSEFAADITAVRNGKAMRASIRTRRVLRAHLHHRRHAHPADPGRRAAERAGRRAGHPAPDRVRWRQDPHHAGGLPPGDAQVSRSRIWPACPRWSSGGADGRAPGQGGRARRHCPCARAAVEARQDRRSARCGVSWPGSSAGGGLREASRPPTTPARPRQGTSSDVLLELRALRRAGRRAGRLRAAVRRRQELLGGTFDSNLSFVQALTEAAKLVAAGHRAGFVARVRGRGWQPAWGRCAARAGEDLRPGAGALEAGRDRRGLRDRAAPAVRAGAG